MAESEERSLKKSKSAPKLKASKDKLKESPSRKSSASKDLDALISKTPSAAASEFLLAQQSAPRSRSSESLRDNITSKPSKPSKLVKDTSTEKIKKDKTPSKSNLASTTSPKPSRSQSSILTVRRRGSDVESSDSVGEATLDISSSPEREAPKRPRKRLAKKPVNPNQISYAEVAKEWMRLPNSVSAPKRKDKMSGKEIAMAVLWDRKHGL
eukprot:TRINITY_DN2823_c0_g2_i1.p1 TRINITY_DN2823_c0_g2~~TRINITY_DN2823_c0_g2_i1.p1  ORF type:complete len:231 (-),score=27.73 TRINITY_DN2823_c0_g2_i1:139-771(-)